MNIREIIQDTLTQSNAGTIHFGQVVSSLMAAGVESYQVDYRAKRATYYLPDGQTFSYDLTVEHSEIAEDFSATQVKAAILGAQSGQVMYPEFKALTQAAGCTGYIVWLSGQHVSYFGRRGEVHVEHFPKSI